MIASKSTLSARAASFQWFEMSTEEVQQLAARLVTPEENASIKQHPCFNERFRRPLSKPTYLKCVDAAGTPQGFVGLIRLGLPWIKCGFVIDGPVFFGRCVCAEQGAERALVTWLRSHGYAFVRFSHRDKIVLQPLASLPEAVQENPLPFVLRYGGELLVHLKADDDEMLAGFQRIARRDIRDATQAGCEVRRSSDLKTFQNLWPMFTSRAREKGFRIERLEQFESMFALNLHGDFARLYVGYYVAQPVFSLVLLRERTAAYCMLAALDLVALGNRPSPACLVRWQAMRDYRDVGCSHYNMGLPGGAVYASKRKFHPYQAPSPFTVTWVLRPLQYRVWLRVILTTVSAALRVVKTPLAPPPDEFGKARTRPEASSDS